nr:hypothetical protein [Smaragdicoccus niigatensis]
MPFQDRTHFIPQALNTTGDEIRIGVLCDPRVIDDVADDQNHLAHLDHGGGLFGARVDRRTKSRRQELEYLLADPNYRTGVKCCEFATLDGFSVEQRAVGRGVDEKSPIMCVIETNFAVVSRDFVAAEQETSAAFDSWTLAPDEKLIIDRDRAAVTSPAQLGDRRLWHFRPLHFAIVSKLN